MADNVLARIPGEFVARAIQALLKQAPPGAVAGVEQDVLGVGRVKFTAVRMSLSRGRHVHEFWTVESAELLAPKSP